MTARLQRITAAFTTKNPQNSKKKNPQKTFIIYSKKNPQKTIKKLKKY
jgi:hypothetical protein